MVTTGEGVRENGEFGHICVFFDIERGGLYILHDRRIRLTQVVCQRVNTLYSRDTMHMPTSLFILFTRGVSTPSSSDISDPCVLGYM